MNYIRNTIKRQHLKISDINGQCMTIINIRKCMTISCCAISNSIHQYLTFSNNIIREDFVELAFRHAEENLRGMTERKKDKVLGFLLLDTETSLEFLEAQF